MAEQKPIDTSAATGTAKTGANFVARKGATRVVGQVVGSVIPGAGNVVATAATETLIRVNRAINKIRKALGLVGKDFKDTFAKTTRFGIALAASIAVTSVLYVCGAIIVGAILVSFIMFVINSGAYMVPYRNTGGAGGEFAEFGEIEVGASCPIPGGVVLWGSYGSPYSTIGHGTNAYWSATGSSCSSYTIPEFSSCYSKKPGDYCYNQSNSCTFYGYAADFIYPNTQVPGQPIYLPYINGESVMWTVTSTRSNHAGVVQATQGGKVYEMNILHLQSNPRGGQSGAVTGVLRAYRTPHIHVELRIDGEYVPPEFMCVGGGAAGPNQSTVPLPACGSIGGECVSTPSCSRLGRNQLAGSCTGGANYLCCSRPVTAQNSCQINGGNCIGTAALQLLTPGATTCEQADLESVTGTCSTNSICCKAN